MNPIYRLISTENKKLVSEFHNKFEVQKMPNPTKNDLLLRYKYFAEEQKEFGDAFILNDTVEMIDAIIDMCYVYLGTCDLIEVSSRGFDLMLTGIVSSFDIFLHYLEPSENRTHDHINRLLQESLEEVHRSNMTKEQCPDGGKIRKGANYSKPNLKPILDKYLSK